MVDVLTALDGVITVVDVVDVTPNLSEKTYPGWVVAVVVVGTAVVVCAVVFAVFAAACLGSVL